MELQAALKWMALFNDKIQENKALLIELDTPIGDSDHGSNMARGMQHVTDALAAKEPVDVAELFKTVAMQLLSKVGGASGPLYGSAFLGLSKAAQQGASLVDQVNEGLAGIQKRGKAEVGEKTMVDVWSAVANALAEDNLTVEAVKGFVEATKDIKATKGRASYVGDRSIGHIDPGSYSSGLLFEAMMEAGVTE